MAAVPLLARTLRLPLQLSNQNNEHEQAPVAASAARLNHRWTYYVCINNTTNSFRLQFRHWMDDPSYYYYYYLIA